MQARDVELGYFAHPDLDPDGGGSSPGVVMLHDVWGLSEHTRDLARRLAGEGFAVLALDLYRREGDVAIDDPGAFMRGLSDPRILEDCQRGIDFLAAGPASASSAGRKVGITGFCMGGMYALLAACSCRGLSAAVSFYGMLSHEHGLLQGAVADPAKHPRQPLDAVADLGCPLLAFYGDEDAFIPLSDVEVLEQRLAVSSHTSEVVVYPGAGHAFLNDTRPAAYRPDAAKDAWACTLAFFRRYLEA